MSSTHKHDEKHDDKQTDAHRADKHVDKNETPEKKRADQRGTTDAEKQAKVDDTYVPVNPFQADAAAHAEDPSVKGTTASYDIRAKMREQTDKDAKPANMKVSHDVVQKHMDDAQKQAADKRKQAQALTDEADELEKDAETHKANLAHMKR